MMTETTKAPNELIERAVNGDESARTEMLELYRDHLRRMVAARLDRRLTPRVDASDVVQDTLTEAAGRAGRISARSTAAVLALAAAACRRSDQENAPQPSVRPEP